MFWCGFHLIKEFTYTSWLSLFINQMKPLRKRGDLERKWEWQALISEAGLSYLTCKMSHYPWEGRYQSPKSTLSQPSKGRVTEITCKFHINGTTLPVHSLTTACHTTSLEPVGALMKAPRRDAMNKSLLSSPFISSLLLAPAIHLQTWNILNLHQMPMHLFGVSRAPTYDLSPLKGLEKYRHNFISHLGQLPPCLYGALTGTVPAFHAE